MTETELEAKRWVNSVRKNHRITVYFIIGGPSHEPYPIWVDESHPMIEVGYYAYLDDFLVTEYHNGKFQKPGSYKVFLEADINKPDPNWEIGRTFWGDYEDPENNWEEL